MTKYELIAEALQDKVNSGELTLEDANRLNDLAYTKYVIEAKDNSKDLELIEQLKSLVESGKVSLDTDTRKAIKELVEGNEEESDDSDESEDSEDEE